MDAPLAVGIGFCWQEEDGELCNWRLSGVGRSPMLGATVRIYLVPYRTVMSRSDVLFLLP